MITNTNYQALLWALFISVFSIAQAGSADIWMSDVELKTTFAGKTVAGRYPNGRGFIETYHIGGRVQYRDEQRRVSGRWSITGRSFCTIYDKEASGGCYSVRRMSDNCYEFYFISRTDTASPNSDKLSWTAQAWLSDQPSTCVAGSEV